MENKIITSLLFLALSFGLNAQEKNYSTIYFYRPKPISVDKKLSVKINKKEIHLLPQNSKLAYKIYSEGRINIEIESRIIDLVVEHGKEYYIKCSIPGLAGLAGESAGRRDFNNDKLYPNGYVQLEEDPNNPIISKGDQLSNNNSLDNAQLKQIITKNPSDVDMNIPINSITKQNTYALIIGNEDYSSNQTDISTEVNVQFAENDARIFKEYCVKTLGIPDKNILLLINATGSKMLQNLDLLSKISKANKGLAELILFYAGHGLPDEQTKEPYLIPVDVSGDDLKYAIKLSEVYKKLTENPSAKITVFIDACFSGGARNEALLTLRGVKVKPKEDVIGNNLVVFTSSSGDESSASYKSKQHGLFTYYLLKKLQDSKGNCTYEELEMYLKKEIPINSLLINKKEQTPQVIGSPDVLDNWKSWKIK